MHITGDDVLLGLWLAASGFAVLLALFAMSAVSELDSKLSNLGEREDQRRRTQVGIAVFGMLYVVAYVLLAATLVYRSLTNS